MGYESHRGIIVTGWQDGAAEEARAKAIEIFSKYQFEPLVSPVTGSITNGYTSFFIAPDGSKRGWGTSERGDECRAEFIAWLREENEYYFDWVEVRYGDDDGETAIRNDSDRYVDYEDRNEVRL